MSSYNALTSGIYSQAWLLPDENVEAYLNMAGELYKELHPDGAMECTLVEQIISDTWRLGRLHRAERTLFNRAINRRWENAVEAMPPKYKGAWCELYNIPEVRETLERVLNESAATETFVATFPNGTVKSTLEPETELGDSHKHNRGLDQTFALQKFIDAFDISAAALDVIVPPDGSEGMARLDRQRRAIRKDLLNSYSALDALKERRERATLP